MILIDDEVIVSFLEKLWIFGQQNIGDPIVFEGKQVLIYRFKRWRNIGALLLLLVIVSQHSFFPKLASVILLFALCIYCFIFVFFSKVYSLDIDQT